MAIKLITPPAIEPLGLEEVENYLRIDSEPDITLLTQLITTARREAEKITGRQLITATWEMRWDAFPDIIYLQMPPLQTVTSVSYLDWAGVEQTLTENVDYLVDSYSEPARITANYGYVWPPIYPVPHAVRVRFVSGYGDEDTDVPEPIRNWMMAAIGTLYENRETLSTNYSTVNMVDLGFINGLLDGFRAWGME